MTTTADVLGGRAAWSCEAGDALSWLRGLPADCVHCCVTSPPYFGLRDYGVSGQLGLEATPAEYVEKMVAVFREVRRVLHPSGTLWLNIGDSYSSASGTGRRDVGRIVAGNRTRTSDPGAMTRRAADEFLGSKQMLGIPWRVAFALQADGWYLRSDIIWAKPNPMPESVTDRPGKAHEYVFLLAKSPRYYYDANAIREDGPTYVRNPGHRSGVAKEHVQGRHTNFSTRTIETTGRNKRSVWTVNTKPFKGAHFAVMPKALVEPCVKAGASERGVCPQCASPWKRKTKRTRTPTRPGAKTKVTGDTLTDGNRDPQRHCTLTETVGWKPGCECGADPVPAVVMDPFAGSGTVAAVAVGLGRRFVGCDLNADYLPLVAARMATVTPPAPQTEAA